jgi:glutathione-specific gamma-glutamylcyclotransferase
MWIFGYGSLMWDCWEGHHGCVRRVRAELPGYQRAFNKASVRNWGTNVNPCPTLNIVKSSSANCRGIAFEFPDDRAAQVRKYLLDREGKGFALRTLGIRLDDGTRTDALVPIYEGKNILLASDLPTLRRMILTAHGTSGSGSEYVLGVARELQKAGIEDVIVAELAAIIAKKS